MNPYTTINAALTDAPSAEHESILRSLIDQADISDHALRTTALLKLVEMLLSRVSYLEAEVKGHSECLSHHNLDV